MLLEGSCHCQSVRFRVRSTHPVPFNRCYCTVCRKTGGGGGYAINLGADASTLEVVGREFIKIYRVQSEDDAGAVTISEAQRHFCGECGSALWVFDARWPELLHPFASAIDTDLPVAPRHTHMMLASKADWTQPEVAPDDAVFEAYPDVSLALWHQRLGLESST
jgi:hypothetical protein